jgi:predicted 3-demethylubiquinone-9 3-methyltransferase (glyoxalase superfamily)
MQKITPFLWFDRQAEEAANFYTSIFKNSKIGTVSRYGEAGPGPKGTGHASHFPARWRGIHGPYPLRIAE